MWIGGRRRGRAKKLADHLLRTDENEIVKIHELDGFALQPNGENLHKALKEMEAIGYGKGSGTNLYHVILAPAYGENLNQKQREFLVNYYVEQLGFKNHQFALVEHKKNGKQHFHLVVNLINSLTGKIYEEKFSKNREWKISRSVEEILGLSYTPPKGKSIPTWAIQRGKRTGIDPREVRKQVTELYNSCGTTNQFVTGLYQAGFALTKGKRNHVVLVDKVGDTHGLMRMIEGNYRLKDLRRKFHGIEQLPFTLHSDLVKLRRKNKFQVTPERAAIQKAQIEKDVKCAFEKSETGAEFLAALNKRQYFFSRGLCSFILVDRNGDRHDLKQLLGDNAKILKNKFLDIAALKPSPALELIRRLRLGIPSRYILHPFKRISSLFQISSRGLSTRLFQLDGKQPHSRSAKSSGAPARISIMRPLLLRLAKFPKVYIPRNSEKPFFPRIRPHRRHKVENVPNSEKMPFCRTEWKSTQAIAWASENGRIDVLAEYGFDFSTNIEL